MPRLYRLVATFSRVARILTTHKPYKIVGIGSLAFLITFGAFLTSLATGFNLLSAPTAHAANADGITRKRVVCHR
ncbi:MAG: hypothetical protein WD200_00415, partial [Candidatus Andersenbacteria bacterium]